MSPEIASRVEMLNDVGLPKKKPPLVLIACFRPNLLREVLEALEKQTLFPDKIIAFVDGPRNESEKSLIDETCLKLSKFSSIIPVEIIKRSRNMGCDENILDAISSVLSKHESIVYLEEDIVPNMYFYDRMCRLLEFYRENEKVCSVSAYSCWPKDFEPLENADFILSKRVFSWGWGTWSNKWSKLNMIKLPKHYNPYGKYYKIPATVQTKMTMINQFYMEANDQADWVITFTLAALRNNLLHIIPTRSLVKNIGFNHILSKSYKGPEPSWFNSRYDENYCPNRLPNGSELPKFLENSLTGSQLAEHILENKGIWVTPQALFFFMSKYFSINGSVIFLKLFFLRFNLLLKSLLYKRNE
jgi:hypothetical protein